MRRKWYLIIVVCMMVTLSACQKDKKKDADSMVATEMDKEKAEAQKGESSDESKDKEEKENEDSTEGETGHSGDTDLKGESETGNDSHEDLDIQEKEDRKEALTKNEAKKLLHNVITPSYYSILDKEDTILYQEKECYHYVVTNENMKEAISIIIDKNDGTMYCYGEDGTVSSMDSFLLENIVETTHKKDEAITQEKAVKMLKKISHEKLQLPVEISNYTLEVDDWYTNIQSKECYGISAYTITEKKSILMGTYYVATDGSGIYMFDATQDMMVEIK